MARRPSRRTAPVQTLLREGREVRLILDDGAHVPLYAGETLEAALARAHRERPEARRAILQAWWNGYWTYGERELDLEPVDRALAREPP